MRQYIGVVAIGLFVFFWILFMSSVLPFMATVVVLMLWLVLVGLLLYRVHCSRSDSLSKLRDADKRGMFSSQVQHLTRSYMAIHSYEQHLTEYSDDSSIRRAYDMLAAQMDNIIESATKYISTYNYYARPIPSFLEGLVGESVGLVKKVNELQSLVLQVEDSTSDVDISYVDDLLSSLREMQNK